jgi:protease IV
MSLDADQIVDRRRMRRKLTFWRVAAIMLAVLAVLGIAGARRGGSFVTDNVSGAIARIGIDGLIRSDAERVQALERLGRSQAKAVIVHINSPGGTTAGSEELYNSLIRLKDKKPMVVVVDGLAASGGYITAIAADHIVSQETALVGSIGVLFQFPNVSELLGKIGVSMEEIKSSPLKAAPNGFEPTSQAAHDAIAALVKDSYDWFRNLVQTRRGLDDAGLKAVDDGRVFTGRQGIPLKLVDELGDERTAIAWLAKEHNIDPATRVRDYELHSRLSDLPFLRTATRTALDAVGLDRLARSFDQWGGVQTIDELNLDGLLALWHPSSGK